MAFQTGFATDYIHLSHVLVALLTNTRIASVAINAAGSGYVVGDVLTISGGTQVQSLGASVEVTAVDGGGGVTGARIFNCGGYSAVPTSPAATTGGSGTGATFDLTTEAAGWTAERDIERDAVTGDREVIVKGVGGGSDEIFVGWRTFQDAGLDYYNWELHGFTGFGSGLDIANQPGASPGFFDGAGGLTSFGCYVPLANQSIEFWLFVTPRRIAGIFRIGTAYPNLYMGFLNPFATTSEFPYPLYVAGCTAVKSVKFSDNRADYGGMIQPRGQIDNPAYGPGFVRFVDGQWYPVQNLQGRAPITETVVNDRIVWPAGDTNLAQSLPEPSKFAVQSTPFRSTQLTQPNRTFVLADTPDSGGDIAPMFPGTIIFSTPSVQVIGELDGVFWLDVFGGRVTEDVIETAGGEVFIVFQNCTRTEDYEFFAIRRA